MSNAAYTDKTTAVAAALSICESLIALSERKVIGNREMLAVLEDAAASHRNVITLSPNPDEHRAIAALIQRIIEERSPESCPQQLRRRRPRSAHSLTSMGRAVDLRPRPRS